MILGMIRSPGDQGVGNVLFLIVKREPYVSDNKEKSICQLD